MQKILFLCLFAIIAAAEEKGNGTKCESIKVRNKLHKKEILGKGLNRPYQLSYDQSRDRVYFSHNIGKAEEDSFEIGYLVKGHHSHEVLHSVDNGFATAIDNKNGILYIGGSNGIFKQHLKSNGSEIRKVISGYNVWDMFFKEHLYFISYPKQHLYKLITTNGKHTAERQTKFNDKLYQFVIDGDDDTFITNDKGLFKVSKKTDEGVGIGHDVSAAFRAIEINNKGQAYIAGRNAIYVPNKKNHSLDKIADIKNIFGITFDREDNIIYSNPTEIVRLLPEECE